MQTPLFDAFGIDEKLFWKEVNALPEIYQKKGTRVSSDTIYLNHLISYVKNGILEGLTNAKLRELGKALEFCPGLPELFPLLQAITKESEAYKKHNIELEHYIISTGIAEMIRGSKIARYVTDIFGCEFIEAPMPPHFSKQEELLIKLDFEISQVGTIVDNTIKTRYIFEINKGGNKNPSIDVNAYIEKSDRRIPIDRMIYVADGPSDIPCFSVVKKMAEKPMRFSNQKMMRNLLKMMPCFMQVASIPMAQQTTQPIAPPLSGSPCIFEKFATRLFTNVKIHSLNLFKNPQNTFTKTTPSRSPLIPI